MSIVTKTGNFIIKDAIPNTTWVKFSPKSKVAQQWGLREIVKTYDKSGKISEMSYEFSTNPLFGYQRLNGTLEQMRIMWRAITQFADKESVARFLDSLASMR